MKERREIEYSLRIINMGHFNPSAVLLSILGMNVGQIFFNELISAHSPL